MMPLLFWGGWLLLGLAVARVAYYLNRYEDNGTENVLATVCIIVLAPALAALGVVAGIAYAATRLVTLPTRAERRQRRQATLEQERQHIRAEARRLGLPMLEDDHA
jgi:hypothetical protein